MSGFDDYSKYIYALETGLSADPAMLWRVPDGRNVTLISKASILLEIMELNGSTTRRRMEISAFVFDDYSSTQ
jgi:hypothetical protein